MTLVADFLIIGGGIAGLSLAAALPAECEVILVEKESTLAFHTSGRSARQMQPSYGPHSIRTLTQASIPLVGQISAVIGHNILRPRPLIWFARAGHEGRLLALLHDVPRIEMLDDQGTRSLNPALRLEKIAAAAVDMDSYEVQVSRLIAYFESTAIQKGVLLQRDAPVLSAHLSGTYWDVRVGNETVSTPTVVNAAGPWADSVARLFGVRPLGVIPHRRTVAVGRPVGQNVDPNWAMASDVSGSLYFRPEGVDILMSPSEEVPTQPHDARPKKEDLGSLREHVNSMTSLDVRSFTNSWTGLRAIAPDHLPVVGRDCEVPGFYWLAGQGGYGIQTASALANLVSADLMDRRTKRGPDLSAVMDAFSPARFSGHKVGTGGPRLGGR